MGLGVCDNTAKVRCNICWYLCSENDGLGTPVLHQSKHLVQWERAANIRIDYEKLLWLTLQNDITEVIETASGSKSLIFTEVFDGCELRELIAPIVDE